MSYCYSIFSKGYVSDLKPIQRLIPNKYLFFKCLLDNKIFWFNPSNDDLLIYNEKGLLKQLDLFKKFKNKFDYIYNKKYGYLFVLKNKLEYKKNICLDLYFDIYEKNKNIKDILIDISELILMGYKKNIIKNILIYHFIRKYKMKIPSNLNDKEQFEYKKKKLISLKEISKFKSQFNLDYNESKKLILKIKKDKDFIKYYKKNVKKFKTKSFEKEIKEIKKSIFFTCKVSTKYKKLFPNY